MIQTPSFAGARVRGRAAPVLCLVMMCLLSPLAARVAADPMHVDQMVSPTTAHASVFGDVLQAQTFTVGRTGTLTRLDLFITRNTFATGPLLVDVRPTVAGVPMLNDGAAFVSFSFSGDRVPYGLPPGDAFRIAFPDSGLSVRAGDVLAFALRSPESARGLTGEYSVAATTTGAYRRGDLFTYSPTLGYGAMTRIPGFDLAFTSYVSASPVPEPASIVLLATGTLAMASLGRRRRVRGTKARVPRSKGLGIHGDIASI